MPSDPPEADPRDPVPRVLITRPEPQAREFATALGRGAVVISPILQVEAVAHDSDRLARADGVVLTSVHAVPAALPGRGRTAFCVGPATASAARAGGFRVIEGPGDLAGLRPMIAQSALALIHPHGRHVAGNSGVPGLIVYDQVAVPLNATAQALLAADAPVILPLFSPRAARLVAAATKAARAPLRVVALSEGVAQAWRDAAGQRGGSVTIAERPAGTAMLDAIRPLLSGNIPDRHGLNRM